MQTNTFFSMLRTAQQQTEMMVVRIFNEMWSDMTTSILIVNAFNSLDYSFPPSHPVYSILIVKMFRNMVNNFVSFDLYLGFQLLN